MQSYVPSAPPDPGDTTVRKTQQQPEFDGPLGSLLALDGHTTHLDVFLLRTLPDGFESGLAIQYLDFRFRCSNAKE